jgi:hypothetical protein
VHEIIQHQVKQLHEQEARIVELEVELGQLRKVRAQSERDLEPLSYRFLLCRRYIGPEDLNRTNLHRNRADKSMSRGDTLLDIRGIRPYFKKPPLHSLLTSFLPPMVHARGKYFRAMSPNRDLFDVGSL